MGVLIGSPWRKARAAYLRAAKLPLSSAQQKQRPKAIAEAQRGLNEAPARDRALLEPLRVGLQQAAGNVGMRVAYSFELGVELMRTTLVILTRAWNAGTIIDAGDVAA